MAEIISTEDVHLYYGKKEALHGISMNFHENEITALIGPSGCGKSTIVKLILRLYEPDSGEILLNGEKIETFSREQIWKLFGVLFQDYAKYPVSVADNIAPGADACLASSMSSASALAMTRDFTLVRFSVALERPP